MGSPAPYLGHQLAEIYLKPQLQRPQRPTQPCCTVEGTLAGKLTQHEGSILGAQLFLSPIPWHRSLRPTIFCLSSIPWQKMIQDITSVVGIEQETQQHQEVFLSASLSWTEPRSPVCLSVTCGLVWTSGGQMTSGYKGIVSKLRQDHKDVNIYLFFGMTNYIVF